MTTRPKIEVGYGLAKGKDAAAAGREAAGQAVGDIKHHSLSAVLVFASVAYDLPALLSGIEAVVGQVPVLGCTTAGEICDAPRQQTALVVALASPYLQVTVGVGRSVSAGWQEAVAQAVGSPGLRPFFDHRGGGLGPDLIRRGKAAFALLLSPGNTRRADSRSYEILEELKRLSQGRLPISGGSTADDWQMDENYVLWDGQAHPDSLLVAVFETELRFGIGLAHGFRPGGQKAIVTRAQAHEVLELDHQPAAEVYARLLGLSRPALEGKHLTLATGRPVGVPDPYGQYSINVASYFTPSGGVRFSQPVQEGTGLTIMEAVPSDLIAAGPRAMRRAILRGNISAPAVSIVFACALRTPILGERSVEEIAAMKALLPQVPLVGFYSFGEQGVAGDGVNRHNNGVVSVLVLGQELTYAAQVALENERLRQELADSERRFRILVESMDDVIFTLDRAQRHTGVYGRWLAKQGLAPEFFLGKTAREIMGPEAAVVHEAANERALAGENVVYEWSIEGAGGIEHYQTSLSPIQARQGQVVGLVGVGRDITERIQAELDRERLIEELEATLAKVKTLRGLLPICASCKKIRDDQGYWTQVEVYVQAHSEADFSHGLCPDCHRALYPPEEYPYLYDERD